MEQVKEVSMKRSIFTLVILAFFLPACLNLDVVTAVPNFAVTPSRPPSISSPTPIILYPTSSITPPVPTIATTIEVSPTFTPFLTPTFTPTFIITNTPAPEPLTIQLLGCDTGFDVTHSMGEVTNAYVTVSNASSLDLTTVCATLTSADEGRIHPDKTVCIASLPSGYEVTLKLTIDTTFQVNTIVEIAVLSNEGSFARAGGLACTDIGAFKPAEETIGVLQPIP